MEITLEDVQAFLRECHLFAKLTDEEVAATAEKVEVFSVPPGEIIYRRGIKSDGLYFIFQGRVRVSATSRKGSDKTARSLAAGDYFGEEALVYGQVRLTQATSKTESIVLRVSRHTLNEWIDDFPMLLTPLRLIEESFFLTYDRPFPWLAKDERLKYACRRSEFVLWRRLLAPIFIVSALLTLTVYLAVTGHIILAAVAFCLLVMMVPWVAWLAADWKNDFLVVTNRRIVSVEKVILLYDTRHEVPLESIQSFGIESDPWGRFFGFGSIAVRSFTASQLLKQIPNPPEVMNIMQEVLDKVKSREKEEERKAAETAMRVRLGLETEQDPGVEWASESAPTFFEAGAVPGWLATFFGVRIEEGETITYRTHWMILFKKLFMSNLILLLIPTLLAVGYSQKIELVSNEIVLLASAAVWFAAFLLWVYRYLDWHNDRYVITSDQIMDVDRKPFGSEESRTASLSSILGIEYARKGLMGLLFNYGTVFIKIGDSDFTFDNVYNPSSVQQELFQKLNEYGLRQKKTATEEERERMADLIETYHNIYKGEPIPLDDELENEPEGG